MLNLRLLNNLPPHHHHLLLLQSKSKESRHNLPLWTMIQTMRPTLEGMEMAMGMGMLQRRERETGESKDDREVSLQSARGWPRWKEYCLGRALNHGFDFSNSFIFDKSIKCYHHSTESFFLAPIARPGRSRWVYLLDFRSSLGSLSRTEHPLISTLYCSLIDFDSVIDRFQAALLVKGE